MTDRSDGAAPDDGDGVGVDADVELDVTGAASDLEEVHVELSEQLAAGDGPGVLGEFVEALRAAAAGDVRSVARYEAGTSRLLYLREDLRERYTDAEVRERLAALVMHGLGAPTEEGALADFGSLNATFRWYDEAVVAVYPVGEWGGVVATFDRRASPLVDVALEHLE